MDKESSLVPQYIFSAFIIALYIVFLVYLFKLEKIGCDCALNWKRNYMITFMIFALSTNFVSIIVPSLRLNAVFAIIFAVLSLMFLIITIQYVQKLKNDKCDCSKDLTREIMFYYSWIMLVLFWLSVAILLYVLYLLNTRTTSGVKTMKPKGKRMRKIKK
jgi:hypothetical protein